VAIAVIRRRRSVPDQMDATDSPALPDTPYLPWLQLAGLCVLVLLLGQYTVLAVPLIAFAAYRWPRWYGAIGLGALVASGLLTVFSASGSPSSSGAFGAPAQACALIALTVALMPVLPAFDWPERWFPVPAGKLAGKRRKP